MHKFTQFQLCEKMTKSIFIITVQMISCKNWKAGWKKLLMSKDTFSFFLIIILDHNQLKLCM